MAKVQIKHKESGVISSVSPAEAKALKENPRFENVYTFEDPVKDPAEVKTTKPGKSETFKSSDLEPKDL